MSTDMFDNDLTKTDSFGTPRTSAAAVVTPDNQHEPEHSPLPWSVGRNDRIESNGRVIADMTFSSHSERRASANAAFIVRACNEHEQRGDRIAELEAALRNILTDCQTAQERRTVADWDFATVQAIEYAEAVLNREGRG